MEDEALDIHEIPLPNQSPSPVDIKNLPIEILQSQVVSDLVSQNEDLMARLSINLKRNAELESKITQESNKFRDYQRKTTLLNDQVLILKEKNRTVNEKQDGFVNKIVALEKQVKDLNDFHSRSTLALENQIEALTKTEQNLKTVLTSSQENYQRRLEIYNRYHRRIRKYIAPQLINLKSQFMHLIDDTEGLKTDWYYQKQSLEKKINRLSKFHEKVAKLHPKFRFTLNELNKVRAEHEALLQNHVDTKLAQESLQSQIDSLERVNKSLRDKIHFLEIESHKKSEDIKALEKTIRDQGLSMISMENKVIEAQRRFEERGVLTQTEMQEQGAKLTQARQEKAELEVSLQNRQEKMEMIENLHRDSKIKSDRLESENLSLRALWNDHRQKNDELKLESTSLKALNQELMDKLKSERLENDRLQSQIAQIESSYQKRLGEFENQLTFINNEQPTNNPGSGIDAEQMERLARMETLISEIQTGFASKPRPIFHNDLPQDI